MPADYPVLDGTGAVLIPASGAGMKTRVLAASAVPVTVTGTTSETTLATVKIPGGIMGKRGMLRVVSLWTPTGAGGTKDLRMRMGAGGPSPFYTQFSSNLMYYDADRYIANRNTELQQIVRAQNNLQSSTTNGVQVTNIDTRSDFDLIFTGKLAVGTDSITLEMYLIELVQPPAS